MEFKLLGPVEVRAEGRVLDAGPPQQRHVLAVLAVDAGRSVTAETLIDRVWDDAPDRARHALHVRITGLRRLLINTTGGASEPLIRRSGGYVLDIDPHQVDLHRFRDLLDQGGQPGCPDGDRAGLLREALGLWRGQPLAGLPGAWAERTRQAWRYEYLDAAVAWADTELRLGNPGAVIGPLTELAGEYPFVESLAAVLMRALYAGGRAADALDRYTTVRRRLADELGADPGAELQRVHQAVLRGDVDPAPTPAAARTTPPVPATPAQLPVDVTGFAGRSDHLARLDQLLAHASDQPTAVVISAVSGTAGVGKTMSGKRCTSSARLRHPWLNIASPIALAQVSLRNAATARENAKNPSTSIRGTERQAMWRASACCRRARPRSRKRRRVRSTAMPATTPTSSATSKSAPSSTAITGSPAR